MNGTVHGLTHKVWDLIKYNLLIFNLIHGFIGCLSFGCLSIKKFEFNNVGYKGNECAAIC